jgi:hypothetical protein
VGFAEGGTVTEFRKSTFCAAGECAEAGRDASGDVVMRNNAEPGVVTRLSPELFRLLRDAAKAGEFDDLA